MNAFRLFIACVALGASCAALGQSGERGSIPPGQSKDGSAPADGAIKGGAIVPGESAGIPEKAEKRCDQLSGTLREECLERERAAGTGGTTEPIDIRRKSPERAD